MARDDGETKDTPATPRRLRDARKRGQVAQSAELSGAVSMLCTLLCVIGMAPWAGRRIAEFDLALAATLATVTPATVQAATIEGTRLMLGLSLIPLGVAAGVHLLVSWLQTGPVFSLDRVRPQLERMHPVDGFQRLFALRSLVQAVLMLVKAGIIAGAAWLVCTQVLGDAIRVAYADAGAALAVADKALMHLLLWCGGLFALLGLADLVYQRWQYLRDLRMARSEVQREQRDDQGDGRLKSQRKGFALEQLPREQLPLVPKASLVVRDSGDRVVVLVYKPRDHPSPLHLVAGHADFGAEILAIAHRHAVPTVVDPSLVDALYPGARTGLPVDDRLIEPVLAHLRSLRR